MAVVLAVGPWWTFVVRGVLAILFGIAAFLVPGAALLSLVLVFGVYAVAEGVLNVASALSRTTGRLQPRWVLLLAGCVSVLAGLVAFSMPRLTALTLVWLFAAWSVVRGILELAVAISLRRQLPREGLYVAGGILSVVFGVLLFVFPRAGALVLVLWIAAYAIVFGGVLTAFGVRLRRTTRTPGTGGGLHAWSPGRA